METLSPIKYSRKYKKLRIFLLSLLPFLIVPAALLMKKEDERGIIFTILILADIGIILGLLTEKFYIWNIFFLIVLIVGIFFRINRFPGYAQLLSLGFGGVGFVSLFSSIRFLRNYHEIPYLRYIGSSASIVLFFVPTGLWFKILHWEFANVLLFSGMFLFIPFLFAFTFTLPGSDYVNWGKTQRTVFFQAIIIPIIFFFIICCLMFVFPEFWQSFINPQGIPWNMVPVELLQKPGLH